MKLLINLSAALILFAGAVSAQHQSIYTGSEVDNYLGLAEDIGAIDGLIESDGSDNISAAASINIDEFIVPKGTDAAPTDEASLYYKTDTKDLWIGDGAEAVEVGSGSDSGADLTVTTGTQSGSEIPVTVSSSISDVFLNKFWLSDTDQGAPTNNAPDGSGVAADGLQVTTGELFEEHTEAIHIDALSDSSGDLELVVDDDDEDNSWYPCSEINGQVVCGDVISFDHTAPTLSSATIGSDGETWSFVFDENVTEGTDGSTDWSVEMSDAGSISFSGASYSDDTLTLTGDPVVEENETVSSGLDYTQPGDGIQDTVGNLLASTTDESVTNNSTQSGDGITYLVEEDFEGSGAPSGWSCDATTCDFDYTTTVLEGAESLYINREDAAYKSASTSVSVDEAADSVYLHTMFRYGSTPSNNAEFIDLSNIELELSSSNEIRLNVEGVIETTTETYSIDTDYHLWLKIDYTYNSGSGTEVTLWVGTNNTRPSESDLVANHSSNQSVIDEIKLGVLYDTQNIYDQVRLSEEEFTEVD